MRVQHILYFLVFTLVFTCCDDSQKLCDIQMSVSSIKLLLTENPNSQQDSPPKLYFMIKVLDSLKNDDDEFLTDHNGASRVFLLDTLRNNMIPLYLGASVMPISKKPMFFHGDISIDKNANEFDISQEYFDDYDYISDKDLFIEKTVELLNRSIMIYMDDGSETKSLALEKVPFRCRKIILINKPVYNAGDISLTN